MEIVLNIIIGIVALLIGGAVGYGQLYKRKQAGLEKKREKAITLMQESEAQAETIKKEATARAEKLKSEIDKSLEINKRLIEQMEASLANKELAVKKQEEKASQLKLRLAEIEEEISAKETQIKQLDKKHTEALVEKSGKKEDTIKKEILDRYEKELTQDNAQKLATLTEQIKERAPRTAQKVIINAIQRLCSPTSVEPKVITINVERDIMKGKIVGKDAQNISYFEELLGVGVIFNDLPNTISISAFNLVNRRIAQKALEKLVEALGDITKKTIDETVERSKKEMDKELFDIGKNMVDKIGLKNLDPELIRTIGRLQFRTSYSQNIMRHSMEVGYLAMMMASELGLDVQVCKVGGFLHDLGKAIDQNPDVQGTHDFLTKELMEKYKFSPAEIHAAWTHHESEKPATPEALMVQAADALSASRPGARQESLEKYLERLQALEGTAFSFEGVKKAFAISAGREVRVIVDPITVSDEDTKRLANAIAGEVESKLTYPGKIKINVIRRTKTIEIAK